MRRISPRAHLDLTILGLILLVVAAGCAGPKRLPPVGADPTGRPEPSGRPPRPGGGVPVILGVGARRHDEYQQEQGGQAAHGRTV